MIRVLFGVLAIAFVVMALLLDIPFGYLVLIVVALAAVAGAAVVVLRNQRDQEGQRGMSQATEGRDDLRSLGIMDIRPREQNARQEQASGEAASGSAVEHVSSSAASGSASAVTDKAESSSAPTREQQAEERPQPTTAEVDDPMTARPKKKKKAPSAQPAASSSEANTTAVDDGWSDTPAGRIFHPLLSSLKEALNAHTVCLLKQKDLALEYYIEALVSDNDRVHTDDRFVTRSPLLTATMAQRPVSVRHAGKSGVPLSSLGYYRDPVDVQQVALAPIPRSEALAAHFLVADTLEKDALGSQYHRSLLTQYADLISTLLDEMEYREVAPTPEEEGDDVRPRREIIEEEMAGAREEETPLALAIVHLNRAEVLADDGIGAVASAERTLLRRLDEASPQGRVERFGELTFGIFQRRPLEEVETWATQLQQDMDKETGILEGGVSIGVAMLDDRHDSADTFRADATAALRESYQSGACIIVE